MSLDDVKIRYAKPNGVTILLLLVTIGLAIEVVLLAKETNLAFILQIFVIMLSIVVGILLERYGR